jgi:hypothetical protein
MVHHTPHHYTGKVTPMFRNADMSAPVDSLHYGATDSKPVEANWDGEALLNDDWSYWEATTVTLEDGTSVPAVMTGHGSVDRVRDSHGTVVVIAPGRNNTAEDYADDHEDEDGEPETGTLSRDQLEELEQASTFTGHGESIEGPMMNYWYPVDSISDEDEAADAAMTISDLPLCVVEVGGTYGLALTGGGMDLSWEIAEAFVRIGMLPPVHFADLPSMAGLYPSEGRRAPVLAAMIRALDVEAASLTRARERLAEKYPAWLPAASE